MTWQHSTEVGEVIVAWVAALSELENVHKDRTAKIKTKDPTKSHEYTYADLSSVLETVKPVLEKHGLAVSQPVGAEGVTTLVFHGASAQWLSFGPLLIAPTQRSPQAEGSSITYARRYALLAACNLATEDDDGAQVSQPVAENPLRRRVDALRADWQTLTPEQQSAGHQWAQEQNRTVQPAALLASEEWLSEVEAWVDAQLQEAPADG